MGWGTTATTSLFIVVVLLCLSGVRGTHLRNIWWLTGSRAAEDCTPQQVLLSLGSDATKMHVSWKTAAANCPSEVVYQRLTDLNGQGDSGQEQQPLDLGAANTAEAVGFSYLLSERDMCDSPAASNPFLWHLHRATLQGLHPSAQYRYQIGGGSRYFYFRAAPQPAPDAEFTFIGFGDMGDAVHPAAKSPGAAITLLRLRREVEASHNPAELILHVGDLSYADGNPHIWNSFFEGLQPFAASVPYMVAVGNHEYGYDAPLDSSQVTSDPSGVAEPYQPSWGNFGPDSRGECGVVMARRFHMPSYRGRRDNAPFWYSFDYGSVHFTVISTEHSLVPGSRQYDWLEAELAAVDRCVTPWLVVLLHRPMYVIYPHKSNREVGEHIRNQIESLLLHYKVDLTVSGHVHSYYRTCPVWHENCVEDWGTAQAQATNTKSAGAQQPAGSADASGSVPVKGDASMGDGPKSAAQGLANSHHGITHFVIGSAGRKLSDVERDQMGWCAETVKRWGFARFTVKGSRSLLAEYVSSETGEVLDAVEVQPADTSRGGACGGGGVAVSKH